MLTWQVPVFEGLLSDEIWGVRKACAETIAEFSESLPAHFRTNTLTTWFIRLADDQSRWVCLYIMQFTNSDNK